MQFANGLAVAFLSFGLKRLQMNAVDLLLIREEEKKNKNKEISTSKHL